MLVGAPRPDSQTSDKRLLNTSSHVIQIAANDPQLFLKICAPQGRTISAASLKALLLLPLASTTIKHQVPKVSSAAPKIPVATNISLAHQIPVRRRVDFRPGEP